MGPKPTESASRVAALTGLRGLAAASVVVYHVWQYGTPTGARFTAGPFAPLFENLDVGVTFFFVLSGFLLYRPYARAFVGGRPWPRLRNFAIARFLRIVPAYWLWVLLVAALSERWLFSQPLKLLANLCFLEFAFPSFLPPDMATGNGSLAIVVSWSLVVEAGFYIALPLVVAVAAHTLGRRGRRVAAAFLPAALLAAVGIASIGFEYSLSWTWVRSWDASFPMHGGQFAAGMAGAAIWALHESGRLSLPRFWRTGATAVLVALAALAYTLRGDGVLSQAGYQTLLAAPFALFLLLVVLSPGSRLQSLLGGRVLAGTGLASYSIFLAHDPIIRALRTQELVAGTPLGFAVTLVLAGAATALAATVSYRLLEKPCFALKGRLTATQPASAAGTLRSLVAAAARDRLPEFAVEADRGLEVDPGVVEPLLTPLICNALTYGAPPFAVSMRRDGGSVRVDVEDRGRGIDRRFLPRLFEPYARSEASRSLPGNGLGLATARAGARQLGGDLVYRPAEHGAHFALTLPLASIAAPAGPAAREPRRPRARPAAGLRTQVHALATQPR